jgi:hypothetical protein
MTWRRSSSFVLMAALSLAACGGDDDAGSESLPSLSASTTTSMSPTTTLTPSSTVPPTSSASTSTAVSTTTTAAPAGAELVLAPNGLGAALFGANPDSVITYVRSILGDPSDDSDWVDPSSIGAPCPGSEVRFVEWASLSLFFTDESPSASGSRHFASYTYGPPGAGDAIEPAGLRTSGGVTVGSSVLELQIGHPSAVINPEDELSGPSFQISEGLFGFLTGIGDSDAVISFVGGFGCGE